VPLEVTSEQHLTMFGFSPPYIYTGLFDEEQKSFEIVGEGKTESLGAKAKADFLARTCKRFELVGGIRRMQAVDNPNISRATYLRALRAMQKHDDRMGIPRERGTYPAPYTFHAGALISINLTRDIRIADNVIYGTHPASIHGTSDLAVTVYANDTATAIQFAAERRRIGYARALARYYREQ
jgi:hypothetical protein